MRNRLAGRYCRGLPSGQSTSLKGAPVSSAAPSCGGTSFPLVAPGVWLSAPNEKATDGRSNPVAWIAGAVLAALVTEPARPSGSSAPGPWRIRTWRAVAVAQACLAAALIPAYLYSSPLGRPGLTLFLASLPFLLLGLGMPLAAWRCALATAIVVGLFPDGFYGPELPLLFSVALVAYLCVVGIAHDRRVLFGAWLVTTAVTPVAATRFPVRHLWDFITHGGFTPALFNESLLAAIAVLLTAFSAVVGYSTRTSRSAQRARVEQEQRSAREQAATAILEERSRIARELHDVVAHHMSVIAIHAETAPYKMPDPPPELTDSFAVIRASAVEALTELRRMLSLLRSPSGAAETAPQPGLARVEELAAAARGSGLDVQLRVRGAASSLSPGVDLSAYRIVQEALSNALRHAAGSRVWIDIGYPPGAVHLSVYNTEPQDPPANRDGRSLGSGHGLLGMRERVSMLGGSLTAGPTPDGGFQVRALLPVEADPAEPASLPDSADP